jgi:hypothetical protein
MIDAIRWLRISYWVGTLVDAVAAVIPIRCLQLGLGALFLASYSRARKASIQSP